MRGRLPQTGTYTGAGGTIGVIEVGFEPIKVEIYNETDGTYHAIAIKGMADATGIQTTDSGAGTTDVATIGSNGITIGTRGFSIGSHAALNTNAKVFRWIAY